VLTVALNANTIMAPGAGGHRWVYLNWALGLQQIGCRVIWLEGVRPEVSLSTMHECLSALKNHLSPYGLDTSVALFPSSMPAHAAPWESIDGCLSLDAVDGADLLLNMAYYGAPPDLLGRTRRTALVDIDPGLTQIWMSEGQLRIPAHDIYFTIGETVGQPTAHFPDCGLRWHYTPPPVYLPAWPTTTSDARAPYTTVTNWWDRWMLFRGEAYPNSKRDGFLPFLEVPRHTSRPLELAINVGPDDVSERAMLERHGWRVRDATLIASTPATYRDYIRTSYGEFSCAKPAYIRTQSAWISDRTLCYLASGKPAVVQHTGPSRFLPDDSGLFRFRNLAEAVAHIEAAAIDYERHSKAARALAEEYFDARQVVSRVLELAVP
jgi:hypothetical protein